MALLRSRPSPFIDELTFRRIDDDLMEMFVRHEHAPIRNDAYCGRPHELPSAVAKVSKRAVVFVLSVANSNSHSPSAPPGFDRPVQDIDFSVRREGGVVRVVEPLRLHYGHAQGSFVGKDSFELSNGQVTFPLNLELEYFGSASLEVRRCRDHP